MCSRKQFPLRIHRLCLILHHNRSRLLTLHHSRRNGLHLTFRGRQHLGLVLLRRGNRRGALRLHLNLHLLLLGVLRLEHGGSADLLDVVPSAHVSHDDGGNERGEGGEVVDPLLVVLVDGGEDQRTHDQRALPEEVVVGQNLPQNGRVRRGLFITRVTRTHTQDGHGCGCGEAVADPQKSAEDHGAHLAVDGHAEVGEELDGHADTRQVGNGDLQLAREPGIYPELEHHADDALNDDQRATGEVSGEDGRVRQRRGAEEIGQVNAIARFIRVGGPAHAELKGEAEAHGARDVHLRAVDGLHLLLALLHYPSTRFASPTLDVHLLRFTTLKHRGVGLLQQEDGGDEGDIRDHTAHDAVREEEEKTLQREVVVDLGENAANGRSEDERRGRAGIQSGEVHAALLCGDQIADHTANQRKGKRRALARESKRRRRSPSVFSK